LARLYQQLEDAAANLPLSSQASDIVPGEGNADAGVMLIGEAPGYHEHVQRRPFVGKSGQFLRQTLEEVGYPPASVYISNIVKARPPGNRDPAPAEIEAYKPFLDREIETIKPLLIVTLGRYSMAKFLSDVKISQVHGRLHKVVWKDDIRFVLPMFHPAAGLRSSQVKDQFTTDFRRLGEIVGWIEQNKDRYQLHQHIENVLL